MIRKCKGSEFNKIYIIINEAAQAYKDIIPEDRWKEPYMPKDELQDEIEKGVVFWGLFEKEELVGVMGIQHIQDVTLIRHSYVQPAKQKRGIGGKLLTHLRKQTTRPVLVGTWFDAKWAIYFYQKHGFKLVTTDEKNRLLKKYWTIPERQIETSVVLADQKWFDMK